MPRRHCGAAKIRAPAGSSGCRRRPRCARLTCPALVPRGRPSGVGEEASLHAVAWQRSDAGPRKRRAYCW
eukprot:6824567-Pyramimonas_sp.AAC.1